MKKILSLLSLLMLCVVGVNAEKVIYSWPSDASQANSITLAEGVTVTITGNSEKKIQNGNKITIGGTEYTSMKVSNGAQNTLTLPKEAVGITFYSYVNKDAATDRVPYWKEVAGVEYTEETSGGTMTSYKNGANPDVRSFSFEKTKEVTFTNTGEQLCYVMEVEYAEEGSEVPVVNNKTIGLIPGVWDVDGATFAAYAFNSDTENAWFPFAAVEGAYATQIPDNYTGINIVRLKPATAEGFSTENYGLNWDNVWNQTDDIDFTAIADKTVFTITGYVEGGNSTYTTGSVPTDLTELKATLQKVVNLAKMFGYDTTEAETLIASDKATAEQLTAALQALATGAKDKASEALSQAKAFFEKFDATASANLAPYFDDAEAALAGTDIDAMLTAAQTLTNKIIEEGQSAIGKVDSYLRKMENETVNKDLDDILAALQTGNLQNVMSTLQQLKADITDAATTYLAVVFNMISQGAAAGKDVSKMQTAYNNILTVAVDYKNGTATLVEMGVALYNLIKAVENYKEANTTYTIAGTKDLTGTEEAWQVVEANNMTLDTESSLYTWTAENITVTAEAQPQFKVVITDIDGKQTWVPASEEGNDHNWIITPEVVGGEGVYNITITYDAKTQTIDVTGENTVVEGIIPDGTYYVMNANEGTLINAASALDAKGAPVTFTFNAAANAYTIEGADFFSGKQWTIADAAEGMSGFYTISTPDGFLAVSATNTLEQIADGTADAAVWILLQKSYWEDIVNSTYTIAGTKNLTGTENDWDIDEANQMTYNDETQLYEKKFKRIAIDAENQPEFKVVQTNMAGENIWYPENNWVITTDYVGGEGLYDITITFDPSDFKEVDVIAEKRIVFPENAIVYDFEAAADAGENPANKNGTAANGQAFYGWENPERTDSKRQDYKGYEWAEGSVLPEECHVWRRSDRINGNVAGNDGLKCPSNKEMAVDGLKAGDKVIIVYDAENATDKEIIWAIGDGTAEGGPGTVRATATINGVEAVTGETTIASGAEIVVNSVTPAENGSGYIVFQVKKGMVINQIAIVSMNAEWAEAIAAAQALAEEDGVAVGKLLAAIDEAKGISEPTDEQKAALQTAIDQYKLDNADQEKDETAKVATNGWKKFDGSNAGVCATQYAPAITTYDGRTAQMAECYEGNGNRTGTIIYQDITGLTNGKYKVGFYGNAFSTSQRDGFECTMEDGATDVAYVFANEEKEYISARIATSTTENDFRQFDVEVTDGNIKLGMGKDTEKSTNWHTIQIYQLTWFTTAKEVFAQDQEELKAVIAEAKALLADENKTEGKEALEFFVIGAEQAVDSKMINISELEAVIGNLKDLIAGFKKANWYIDLTPGDYYIIDVESGLKMAAGHDWGTHGIVNEAGLDLTLTPYTESRTVTIDSRVYNGDTSHFLGSNLYMDSSEWGWALEYQGFGFYILEPNGGKYINLDKDNNLVLSDTPREFIIVTKDGVMAQRMEELATATAEAPVDATFLLTGANFNRFDSRNDAWTITQTLTGDGHTTNKSGGNNVNNCAEAYHTGFSFTQTISGAPAGLYKLTAQGFYRQDGEAEDAPVFFIGTKNGEVPVKTGSENNMSQASESFTRGLYTIEPIEFKFYGGDLEIGVKGTGENQWVIFDNFQLEYCGLFESTYTLVGGVGTTEGGVEGDVIFTKTWDPEVTANNFDQSELDNETGTYTKVFSDVELTPGSTIYYKVVADGDWDYNWGFDGNNAEYVVNLPEGETLPNKRTTGIFDITFKFNPFVLLGNGYNVECEVLYDSETTGICTIVAAEAQNGNVYNLNGQKVQILKKGLYIVNGKKQVVR